MVTSVHATCAHGDLDSQLAPWRDCEDRLMEWRDSFSIMWLTWWIGAELQTVNVWFLLNLLLLMVFVLSPSRGAVSLGQLEGD